MRYKLSVEIETSDNTNMYEVRRAVERCLTEALYIYAHTAQARPHHLTGGPVHYFESGPAQVRGAGVADG